MADDYTAVIKAAKAQGIRVEETTRHRVFVAPNGNRMVFPSSSSDRRGIKNLVADLRNGAGFIWPPPSKKELRARRNREEDTTDGGTTGDI